MQTYCSSCRKHTYKCKKVTMTNKLIRQKSKCANCMSDKSRFLEQNHNKKVVGTKIILKLS